MIIAANIDLPQEQLTAFCQRHHIAYLALFGSALRDNFGPESDLDMLVEFEPGTKIGLLEFIGIQRELSSLLGRPVDLVPRDGLKWVIRDEVLASAKAIYDAKREIIPG
jgi:predicted nucleotidyltransferase